MRPADRDQSTFRESAFTVELLDCVAGSLAPPPGGSVRSTPSSYQWWGMTYEQTTHEALDANGNVVGSEVERPGRVWSDRTTNTTEGTTTTYSTGTSFGGNELGGGFNAQFSTHHDADGNFNGVSAGLDAELHANGMGFGDWSARGQANGSLSFSPEGISGQGAADGVVSGVEPTTGIGVELRGQANGSFDIDGRGASYDVGASADVALVHRGEDLASLQLGQVGSHGGFQLDEHGTLNLSGGFRGGTMGHSFEVNGDASFRRDGSMSLEGRGQYAFEIGGRYGGSVGADSTLGYERDASGASDVTGGVNGHLNLSAPFGIEAQAGVTGTAHFDEDGSFQGAEVSGSLSGSLTASDGLSAQGSLSGEANFNAGGELANWSAEASGQADIYGQTLEGSRDWSGDAGVVDGADAVGTTVDTQPEESI